MKIEHIPIERIKADPNQPRKNFVNIGQLSSSILKEGLMSPLEVRPLGEDYFVIDGERRLRALRLIKYEKVPCIIYDKNVDETFLRQVASDFHKNKLDPVEKADAIKKLLNLGYEKREICYRLGIKDTAYYIHLKVNHLNEESKKYIKEGKIGVSILSKFNNAEINQQDRIIKRIVQEKKKSRPSVKKVVLEETNTGYVLNEYIVQCLKLHKAFDQADNLIRKHLADINQNRLKNLKEANQKTALKINDTINILNNFLVKLNEASY